MTNIVGTGLNQAPTNADLGTLAFQDAAGVGELNVNTLTANALRVNNDVSTAVPVVNFNFGAGQNFYGDYCSFTRNSIATYFDRYGVMQIAEANEPRLDYNPFTGECKGLLIESAATNYFLYSESPATQDITISTAGSYTVSFYGTGSIVLSGITDATIVGTGEFPTRTSYTFTATTGTLTLTISGTVQKVQVENNSWASSYIPVYSSAVTRQADNAVYALSSNARINGASVIIETEKLTTNDINTNRTLFTLQNSISNNNRIVMFRDTTGVFRIRARTNSVIDADYTEPFTAVAGRVYKHAFAVSNADFFCIDGMGNKYKTNTNSFLDRTTEYLYIGCAYNTITYTYGEEYNCYIRKLSYYQTRLSNKELTELAS